jgi:hypothetical protein
LIHEALASVWRKDMTLKKTYGDEPFLPNLPIPGKLVESRRRMSP